MHTSFLKQGRSLVLAIALASVVITAPVATGQSPSTPEADCAQAQASPLAESKVVKVKPGATPSSGTPEADNRPGSIVDSSDLIDALEICGVTVEFGVGVEQPFLQPDSVIALTISGGGLSQPVDLQVFEYDDQAGADSDVKQIGPDGQPPTMMITWIEPPHFFRGERLIVLYLGEDRAVIDLLTTLMGPPFAGG